jgi:hypothetical protein
MKRARIVCTAGAMLALGLVSYAASPVQVGQPAPSLELKAADGSSRSLADLDGPAVLIFYRGLW